MQFTVFSRAIAGQRKSKASYAAFVNDVEYFILCNNKKLHFSENLSAPNKGISEDYEMVLRPPIYYFIQ